MVQLAACLAGWGGLLLELVFLRRHGLLLGNTAAASVLTLALFLLGLGIGGLWWPRTRLARARPLGTAALLYALVGVTGVVGDSLLASLPPLPWWAGAVMAVVVPGVPAFLMGGAFPLLFSVFDRHAKSWRAGALVGANLLGSVAAVFVGGNFLIPQSGLAATVWFAVAAYGAAALLVAVGSRLQRRVVPVDLPSLPSIGRVELCAFVSGAVVLGLEILMLRRLPFFLDGFQPTLSGVLAACLLGLTLGSVLGPPLCRRLFAGSTARAAAGSVWLGAVIMAVGLHESLAPAIARLAVSSAAELHLRVVGAALAAAGLPCFFLGATIPLCLAGLHHPETRSAGAGRLFFFQGLGSLVGALAVGHVLPRCLPGTFFLYALPLLGATALVVLFRVLGFWSPVGVAVIGVLAWTGVSGGSAWRAAAADSDAAAAAPVAGSRYDRPGRYRYVDHRTDSVVTASVVYDRSNHGMILFTDQFRAAYIDRDSGYMTVLGHLPFLLRPNLKHVAVIALGTGTTANAVSAWPQPESLDVVEISPAVVSLVDYFSRQGPAASPVKAPFAIDPRTAVHITDGRRYVARQAPGGLDLISMEPLLPYAPGTVPLYTREYYALCRQALADDGLILQWVPTHSMPKHYFETLLATFARGFPHHSAWLVNHSTLLVGSKRPHLPSLEDLVARMRAVPASVRRELHQAGITSADDWRAAYVGSEILAVCGDVLDLVDDRPFIEAIGYWSGREMLAFLPDNLGVLQAIAGASPRWPSFGGGAGDGVSRRDLRSARLLGLRELARGQATPTPSATALAVSQLARARAAAPRSVLLFGELARARRELLQKQLYQLLGRMPEPFDAVAFGRRVERRRLIRYLDREPGTAFLWAVRGLAEPEPTDQVRAMQHAVALDPTIYDRWRQLWVPWVRAADLGAADRASFRGPLEDLAVLPAAAELVRRATGTSPDAVAFRSRFRVRVADGFLAVLAGAKLTAAQAFAFRQVLDPDVLDRAAAAIRHRQAGEGAARQGVDLLAEIVPLWRRDLPMPAGLSELLTGSPAARRGFAAALSGRKSPPALAALGRLMMDREEAVRRAAAATLVRTLGQRIPYDPEWDAARRQAAVDLLHRLRRP